MKGPLAPEQLLRIDAWWRAANYLSVGQIYLYDNPLLKEPLSLRHVKPRLLGHGYKIQNPCILARIPREELEQLFSGYGYAPCFREDLRIAREALRLLGPPRRQ